MVLEDHFNGLPERNILNLNHLTYKSYTDASRNGTLLLPKMVELYLIEVRKVSYMFSHKKNFIYLNEVENFFQCDIKIENC
jgi:hypothetical protein